MKRKIAVAVLSLFVIGGCAADTVPDTQSDVEERLTCQCGCGLTVHSCNHLQCGFAVPVRKDITESLAAGQTGEQIVKRYVEQYGEKILSSPTRTGFNLLAWYGPYVAILVSAALIILIMRRWQRKAFVASARESPRQQSVSAEQRHRLERELERLDE